MLVGFLTQTGTAVASSEAGIDLSLKNVEVLITYSVALDYFGAEYCIRNPECLLFDVVAILQNGEMKTNQDEVLKFGLYQSSNRKGNLLSLVKNPFEGSAPFKELYDGEAQTDLAAQIRNLLEEELVSSPNGKKTDTVTLFKCVNKRTCKDIRFGSFPSDVERTGYCTSPGNGCGNRPIIVRRKEMKKYFSEIPE